MKVFISLFFALILIPSVFSQELKDLFSKSETQVTWLGIDFSHVKLIGDFNQFGEWGDNGSIDIKEKYFPSWNDFVYAEPERYNIAQMIRKENVKFQTDEIYRINDESSIEDMEAKTDPDYSSDDILKFTKNYSFKTKEGLGILFIAESLNKFKDYGKFHFVVLRMSDGEVLFQEELTGKSGGFGLKNYWAKTIYNVIQEITDKKYALWKGKMK